MTCKLFRCVSFQKNFMFYISTDGWELRRFERLEFIQQLLSPIKLCPDKETDELLAFLNSCTKLNTRGIKNQQLCSELEWPVLTKLCCVGQKAYAANCEALSVQKMDSVDFCCSVKHNESSVCMYEAMGPDNCLWQTGTELTDGCDHCFVQHHYKGGLYGSVPTAASELLISGCFDQTYVPAGKTIYVVGKSDKTAIKGSAKAAVAVTSVLMEATCVGLRREVSYVPILHFTGQTWVRMRSIETYQRYQDPLDCHPDLIPEGMQAMNRGMLMVNMRLTIDPLTKILPEIPFSATEALLQFHLVFCGGNSKNQFAPSLKRSWDAMTISYDG